MWKILHQGEINSKSRHEMKLKQNSYVPETKLKWNLHVIFYLHAKFGSRCSISNFIIFRFFSRTNGTRKKFCELVLSCSDNKQKWSKHFLSKKWQNMNAPVFIRGTFAHIKIFKKILKIYFEKWKFILPIMWQLAQFVLCKVMRCKAFFVDVLNFFVPVNPSYSRRGRGGAHCTRGVTLQTAEG